jgi:hypothetical protein
MKINLLSAAAFVVALAMPLSASAQQSQNPGGRGHHATTTPSHEKLSHRWQKRLGNLNLSGDQQQRVQSLIDRYSQDHPEGSPRDPGASRELRKQIMGVMSSDQQNQYRQQMHQRHGQGHHRGGSDQNQNGQQQYQQGGPQQYEQGGPQQYQQGGPQQYQQGGPQQYQQGGPQQYQGGPGPYQGQGPPQGEQGPPQGEQGPPDQGPPPGNAPPA